MSTPSARDLEAHLLPRPPKDLPREALLAVRERSKKMFGNQDRLEVALAITRVELGKVNATDLHRNVEVAVNRIRAQLLHFQSLDLLGATENELGKHMFKVLDPDDHFWKFVVDEYALIVRQRVPASASDFVEELPEPSRRMRARSGG